jgi:putative acetyltransferase
MVILIGGISRAGKTILSQKLMEKYNIPYLSIDHLKMGIYRSNPSKCGYTPESDDKVITKILWPIIKGIIMTNIENNQNIIIEGVNLPYSIKDLDIEYSSRIIFCKICFSNEYIEKYLRKKIIKNENIIEYRGYDFDYGKQDFILMNSLIKKKCLDNNIKCFEIMENYGNAINEILEWIKDEIDKTKK